MSLKSTHDRYGKVAVGIHWLSALAIVALLGSGIRADGATEAAEKIPFLRVHVALGITILVLTLCRIGWWWRADRKPTPLSMPALQGFVSRAVHVLFYIVILGMAASGIGLLVISGAGAIIYGGDASLLPDFWDYPPRTPHGIGAKIMIALFVLHAGAALYHQFVVKDGLLKRMWF